MTRIRVRSLSLPLPITASREVRSDAVALPKTIDRDRVGPVQ